MSESTGTREPMSGMTREEYARARVTATGWACGFHPSEWTHAEAEGWGDLSDTCTHCLAESGAWTDEERAVRHEERAIAAAEIRAYRELDYI